MNYIEECYIELSKMSVEQLFAYLTETDLSERKFIARFLIDKHLQDRAHDLQKKAAAPAERRATIAVVISAIALLVSAAPFLWRVYFHE